MAAGETTEKLAEIIETYLKYDLQWASLSIYLDYVCKPVFHFELVINQAIKGITRLSFDTNYDAIHGEKTFLTYVTLCKDVFSKFNFDYGSFRNRDEGQVPSIEDYFIEEQPTLSIFTPNIL